MKELTNIKEVFDIFVDSCEKAGVKFSKEEEKQVDVWPEIGDEVIIRGVGGTVRVYTIKDESLSKWILKNEIYFKSILDYEKYYSIIDTINNIVDELGRPSWEDFEDRDIYLYVCEYNVSEGEISDDSYSEYYFSHSIFPYCKKTYIARLLEKVSEKDLLWAFKKSMRLV